MSAFKPSRACRSVAPALACAVLPFMCPAAHAAEVVVKNDSLVDGGISFIIGDFAIRDQASVWLTSPCDGAIVAAQIFWLSDPPGAPLVIHENVWIHEAGKFPAPGNELARLESPLLTSGVLNEFRTIDEQGSLLNIPVAMGQTFVVSLEYAEPTFIDSGSPSVVRDVDGCQSGRNAVLDIKSGWFDICLFIGGDFVIRAVVDCSDLTGACCLPSGQCAPGLTAAACSGAGGDYQGDGVSCESVSCPQPTVACCFGPESCLDLTAGDCSTAEGFTAGAGTDCDSHECFVTGACCFVDGGCAAGVPAEVCFSVDATFQGEGVTCENANCPQPEGACCFTTLNGTQCFSLTADDCLVISESNWAGPFTNCADFDSSLVADACECGEIDQDWDGDCDVDGSDYANFELCRTDGTAMAGPLCQCFDTNGDLGISVLDFAELQVNYTGPGTGCP